MTKLKILHAPTTVGGNSFYLSKAEKELGHQSHCLAISQNQFKFPCDECILKGDENILLSEFKTIITALKSLFKYNIYHYNFGRSIFSTRPFPENEKYPNWKLFIYTHFYSRFTELLDLKLAYKLGRVTAVTYNGTDARIYEYCKNNFPIHFVHTLKNSAYSEGSDKYKKQRFKVVEKYTDLIYAVNPDLLHCLPSKAKFLPYTCIDPNSYKALYKKNDKPIHIVHAPTNRAIKGTRYIIEAIDKLKKNGAKFKFTLIEDLTNSEARKLYENADILIDQLLAGFYGGLSVEFMALGKPVICYIRDADLKFLPRKMVDEMPIINAQPDTIYEVLLENISKTKTELRNLGKQSRQYVLDWHDPKKIAQKLINDYKIAMKKKSSE